MMGYISDGVDCVPCPPGTYWELGKCVPCKPGTYNSVQGATKCLPCPSGLVAPNPGSKKCRYCGRLGFTYDGITCVYPTRSPTTPKPTISPTFKPPTQIPTAAPSPVPTCSVGYVYDGATCIPCPEGTYWTHGQCVPCKLGTSNLYEASLECTPCSMGYYAPVTGLASCQECRRPLYSPDGIRCIAPEMPTGAPTQFGECRRGYANIGGVCTRCLEGTYWTPYECVPCAPGTINNSQAHLTCYSCGDRAIAPQPGMRYCTPCDSEWYTLDSITCIPANAPSAQPIAPPNSPPWWCQTFGCDVAIEAMKAN